MSEQEVWKAIPGYEGLYDVSSFGRVRSLKAQRGFRTKPKILNPVQFKSGYYFVTLYKHGVPKILKVSRVVALTFLPNPDNLPQVNHKDENKANNCVDNLEWCDAKYNVNYGTGLARRSKAMMNCASTSRPVNQYDLEGHLLATYPSFMEAHRVTGIDRRGIICCCEGGRFRRSGSNKELVFKPIFTAGGFKWQYADKQ